MNQEVQRWQRSGTCSKKVQHHGRAWFFCVHFFGEGCFFFIIVCSLAFHAVTVSSTFQNNESNWMPCPQSLINFVFLDQPRPDCTFAECLIPLLPSYICANLTAIVMGTKIIVLISYTVGPNTNWTGCRTNLRVNTSKQVGVVDRMLRRPILYQHTLPSQ